MAHHLIPFHFETHSLSVITDDHGEPWWIAAEVCEVLGIKDVSDACKRLDDDEKRLISFNDVGISNPTLHSELKRMIVNEPGLYSLILGSRKKSAKVFKRWITHEVIPQIRKTGSYSLSSTQVSTDPWDILAGLVEAGRKNSQEIRELRTDVRALQSERPPVDRHSCIGWLKDTGKPFLPHTLFENFKSACRRREAGIPFRPANLQHALPYYKIETLEIAYMEVTKQLSFLSTSRRKKQ